jgi:hypothetical protein
VPELVPDIRRERLSASTLRQCSHQGHAFEVADLENAKRCNEESRVQETALHWAAKGWCGLEVCRWLLQCNANPLECDEACISALDYAALADRIDVCQLLMRCNSGRIASSSEPRHDWIHTKLNDAVVRLIWRPLKSSLIALHSFCTLYTLAACPAASHVRACVAAVQS